MFEQLFNSIITFIATMDNALKISIIALLSILDILLLREFIKNIANKNNKPKIKFVNVLLFILVSGIIVLFGVYGF